MGRFVRKFSIWNDKTEHYEFSNDFNEAIWLCEIIYSFNDTEWVCVKQSNDFNELERFLKTKDIEVELDIEAEIKYSR